ncbi:MAG: hypothetical protein ACREPI_07195 [Candidatus Dormibacterales bacterium]
MTGPRRGSFLANLRGAGGPGRVAVTAGRNVLRRFRTLPPADCCGNYGSPGC